MNSTAYFDGDIYARNLYLTDNIYIGGTAFPPTPMTYVTGGSITSTNRTIHFLSNLVVLDSGNLNVGKNSVEIPAKITLTLTTATSYVLGNKTGNNIVSDATYVDAGSGDNETIALSDYLTPYNHTHGAGGYETGWESAHTHDVDVNTITGSGTAHKGGGHSHSVSGRSGTASKS